MWLKCLQVGTTRPKRKDFLLSRDRRERFSYTSSLVFHQHQVMKTTFLFPGQGSQYAGMGKSLADRFSPAREVFEEADRALGFSLSTLCFEGPAEALQLTA